MNFLLEGWSLSPETDDAALEAAEGSEELLELLATEVERKSRGIEDRNSFTPSTRRVEGSRTRWVVEMLL